MNAGLLLSVRETILNNCKSKIFPTNNLEAASEEKSICHT